MYLKSEPLILFRNEMKIQNKILIRILFDLAVFLLVVFTPWWISFPIAIIGQIIFKNYYELFFVGLWIDMVEWNGVFHSIHFFFSILSIIMFLIVGKIRSYIQI